MSQTTSFILASHLKHIDGYTLYEHPPSTVFFRPLPASSPYKASRGDASPGVDNVNHK